VEDHACGAAKHDDIPRLELHHAGLYLRGGQSRAGQRVNAISLIARTQQWRGIAPLNTPQSTRHLFSCKSCAADDPVAVQAPGSPRCQRAQTQSRPCLREKRRPLAGPVACSRGTGELVSPPCLPLA
jgi:hypothetical protein